MAARYGSTESRAILNHYLVQNQTSDLEAIYKHVFGEMNLYWKPHEKFMKNLVTLSGFFPNENQQLLNFVELYERCSANLDLLGVWNEYEEFLGFVPPQTELIKIREMEPWFYEKPWSADLAGKKVLVVHPFEEDIRKQYNIRTKLFKNPKILPEFDLKTIKAVQTIAGEKSEFATWFDALNYMKTQIDQVDFDVAIIGCGAYGFPLAAHVKEIGKQAVHLGGVTQLLFGIKGKRWEGWKHYTNLRYDDGKHWISPSKIPTDYKKIEGGCYW